MAGSFKKTKVKLDLLTDIDIINGKKDVTLFIDMQKLITNT